MYGYNLPVIGKADNPSKGSVDLDSMGAVMGLPTQAHPGRPSEFLPGIVVENDDSTLLSFINLVLLYSRLVRLCRIQIPVDFLVYKNLLFQDKDLA